MTDIPVLLFTGFLDSGKTTFIQKILSDPDFNDGHRILLLQCEEGEVELDPGRFANPDSVFMETLDDESKLTDALLDRLANKYDAEQVLIEYNGTWLLENLFRVMPMNWYIAGETTFADASSFLQFNQNMRQLVYNKLNTADMVIFNRVTEEMDKMALHKVVRGANRQSNIAYEFVSGKTEYDEIVDPLPFDVNADVIAIDDRDYALFYADLMENFGTYHGKTVELTVMALMDDKMPPKTFVGGRQLMQCCAADIQFAALAYLYDHPEEIVSEGWYKVKGIVGARFTAVYGKKGPVIKVTSIRPTSQPSEIVATFY